jgi:hypothetical protein
MVSWMHCVFAGNLYDGGGVAGPFETGRKHIPRLPTFRHRVDHPAELRIYAAASIALEAGRS